jgi:anti-sigma factor RsiW
MDSYLSEELSVESNHGVLRHVAECRDCAAELKRRQRLRALLSETLDLTVSDVDADRVRMRITHAVDRERYSWQRVARLGAVAATLVAAVAVWYWAGGRVDAAAYDDSAEDHVACALTYPSGTVYDPDRAAQNLAPPFEHIVDAVGGSHGLYQVIDAHMCPYKGRNYAHVVIRGDGQTLSLFAERAAAQLTGRKNR